MIFFVADDEKIALDRLVRELKIASPDSEIHAFSKPQELLEYAKSNPCDVAFLDVRMGGMTGMELAKKLKAMMPAINIIFVTGYDEYANEAMRVHASGYLMKPVTSEDVVRELEDLRYPIREKRNYLLYCKCFGSFEVFDQKGDVVSFERKKAKEIFAYLLFRQGKKCSTQELYDVLFEDREYDGVVQQRMYQTLVSSLNTTLKTIGAASILERKYGMIWLDVSKISCDWYDYLRNKKDNITKYNGEFMKQYAWAEVENGNLSQQLYYDN